MHGLHCCDAGLPTSVSISLRKSTEPKLNLHPDTKSMVSTVLCANSRFYSAKCWLDTVRADREDLTHNTTTLLVPLQQLIALP